jgi:hypothetical protein
MNGDRIAVLQFVSAQGILVNKEHIIRPSDTWESVRNLAAENFRLADAALVLLQDSNGLDVTLSTIENVIPRNGKRTIHVSTRENKLGK